MVVACLAVAALVLVACGEETTTPPPAETTTPPPAETTTPPPAETTTPPPAETTTTPAAEKPQYGGTGVVSIATDLIYFDDTIGASVYCYSLRFTNEELLQGDWAKGPAGTGESDWMVGGTNRMDQKAGSLAESWEIPQQGKIIFHIRQGVHWALNPKSEASRLVGGRELTVADVVFSLNRLFTTAGSYFKTGYPTLSQTTVVTTGPDNTVIVTCPVSEWVNAITLIPDFLSIVPPEVVAKYGNMQDWRNSVGTGPFMLTDFVSNSQATYVRNPNYWMTNPCGPGEGDQLPYVDGARLLVIPDTSTAVSAFRTGQLDTLSGYNLSQVGDVLNDTSLPILSKRFMYDSPWVMGMRTDMANSPFSKKDVRQAIMYALDLKAVKDLYYQGDAELLTWPITPPSAEYKDLYVPLEELPANVQALYAGPDVAKSKELLKNAGYPNGFNANVICYNTATQIDIMSMLQADLADVGINMTIDAKDYAVWQARYSARNYGAYEFIFMQPSGVGTYQKMINMRGSTIYNPSYIYDPVVEAAYQEMQKYIGIDEEKCMQVNHDLMPYLIEQCYVIPVPSAYFYAMWWPFVKNYNGEYCVGYYNFFVTSKFTWRDQALKKQMTGQ
jgi:peptide/nickel transport system substrate-binding protein